MVRVKLWRQHKMNKLPLVALGIGLLFFTPAINAIDAPTHLRKHLRALASFTADFTQELIDMDQQTIQVSTGDVVFKRPGKFIWFYRQPYEQQIISDGKKIWIYDKDLEQVTVKRIENDAAPAQTPITILDDPDSIMDYYQIKLLSERGARVEIQLTPLNENAIFNYVTLIFDGNALAGMELYDNFGHYNSLTFANINLQAQLNDEQFSFQTPAGVDMIGDVAE